ncbi:AI-2E family transporter [Herpetosiphon llansteffanensis]|uniref:AI-2E family transporter n=1 Tax=Herpetosiphon llansteffanensis TaxID=2094568 RepID=UPI000D7C16BD|nr:AI-2E family transporter [Herpetosiphon llansteffanensis]
MKQLARVTATILFTIGLVALMWMFSAAVLLFLVSLVIASAVRPFAQRLIDRGMSRGAAYGLVYFASFIFFGSLFAVISRGLLTELQRAGDQLLNLYTNITITWPNGQQWQQTIASELPSRQGLLDYMAGTDGTAVVDSIIGFSSGVFDFLAQLVILLSLSTYWAVDQNRFERLWLSLINAKHRQRARTIWRAVELEVGAYIRSEVAQSSLAGISLGIIFELIGMPYPTLLALWIAIAWLVPWVGVLLALIPAVAMGMLVGLPVALLAGLSTIAVFAMLQIWVEPRLYGANRVSPVLVVLILMVMAQASGILGMLIAPPLAATIQILGRELWFNKAIDEQLTATYRNQLQVLRERLVTIQQDEVTAEVAATAQHQSYIRQIEELMDETQSVLGSAGMLNREQA